MWDGQGWQKLDDVCRYNDWRLSMNSGRVFSQGKLSGHLYYCRRLRGAHGYNGRRFGGGHGYNGRRFGGGHGYSGRRLSDGQGYNCGKLSGGRNNGRR